MLIIEHATVSPDAIRVLLKLPLRALSLRCIPVADQLQFLNTKQLKNLTLRHCGLQNKDAAAIANSHKLQYLDVHGNEYIDRRFILGLESLKKLNALHLTDVHLSTEDCQHITKSFPELRYLTAELSGVEDEAVLKSKLPDFVLLPPYDTGGSPLWGMENEVPVDAHSKDLDK